MTARQLVVDELRLRLPEDEVDVGLATAGLGTLTRAAVRVRVDTVRPSTNPQAWHTYDLALVIVSALQDAEAAEAELDDLLLDVLFAVEDTESLVWTTATRVTVDDSLHGYQVALTVHLTKE